MSLFKKTLKGAAVVAGIGACALLIKKVVKGSSEGYYNIEECEDEGCCGNKCCDEAKAYDEEVDAEEVIVLADDVAVIADDDQEENIIQLEIDTEDGTDEVVVEEASIEEDNIEEDSLDEDKN